MDTKAADAAADVLKKLASVGTNIINVRSLEMQAKMTDVQAFSAGQVTMNATLFGKTISPQIFLDPKQLPVQAAKIIAGAA